MKQYWVFVLNSLVDVAFCAVDGAFGNGISIDAVVVMGSYTILELFGCQFLIIGLQAYKVLQRNEKSCLLLSLGTGIALGTICITCAYQITLIFELTDVQREMLRQAIMCYGFWCPIEAIGRFLKSYTIYKCYNKLTVWSNIGTWALLIGTDWIAIRLGWGVNGLVASTGFSWLALGVVLAIGTKIRKSDDRVTSTTLKEAFSKGKDVMLGGLVSRFANLSLGHFASTMATAQYAIHSVALSVVNLAEEFRDAECQYVIVALKNEGEHKGEKAKQVFKSVGLPALALPITASFLLAFVMHGKVGTTETLYGVLIYDIPMLIYPVYDFLQQFALSKGKTKYSIWNGTVCAIWRIGILGLISKATKINIAILGAVYLFDYASRMVSYYILIKRNAAKEKSRMDGETAWPGMR